MNIKKASNVQARVLQQRNQNRALKANVAKAMVTNTKTIGRQSGQDRDRVELTRKEAPATKLGASSHVSPSKEQNEEQSKLAKQFQAATEDFESICLEEDVQTLYQQAGEAAAKNGSKDLDTYKVVFMANYAHDLLKRLQPSASKKEIREASKSSPALSKVVNLADSSSKYLKEKKRIDTEPTPEVKRAQRAAKNHESAFKIREIYAKMRKDRLESMARIAKINRDLQTTLQSLRHDSWTKRVASQDAQHKAFLATITGTAS